MNAELNHCVCKGSNKMQEILVSEPSHKQSGQDQSHYLEHTATSNKKKREKGLIIKTKVLKILNLAKS